MKTTAVSKVLAVFLAAGISSARAEAAATHGTLAAAPDDKGTLTIIPQGKKSAAEPVAISTGEKTEIFIASGKVGISALRAGMWLQPEIENGIAKKIIAGNIVADDGDACVLFKGLPETFFTDPAGFDVAKFPTHFGPLQLMYRLTGNGAFLRFGRKEGPKGGFIMYVPPGIRGKFYDGHTTQHPDADGKMLWPGDCAEIRMWFNDGTIFTNATKQAAPAETPNANAITLICAGDSITQRGYPAVLQELLGPGYNVINAGHSGITAIGYGHAGGREAKSQPKIVVFMLGTNDAKVENWIKEKDTFVSGYAALVDSYKNLPSHPKLFIALSPPIYRKETGAGFSAANLEEAVVQMRKVAGQTGATIIDVHAATSNQPNKFGDGVHPNDDGKTIIAQTVYEGITGKKAQ